MSVDIVHKCMRVIVSCKTPEQFKVAAKYYLLASKAVDEKLREPFKATAFSLLLVQHKEISGKFPEVLL